MLSTLDTDPGARYLGEFAIGTNNCDLIEPVNGYANNISYHFLWRWSSRNRLDSVLAGRA